MRESYNCVETNFNFRILQRPAEHFQKVFEISLDLVPSRLGQNTHYVDGQSPVLAISTSQSFLDQLH